MKDTPEVHLIGGDQEPRVFLEYGDSGMGFTWAQWEKIVHQASYEYVHWALTNPAAYAELERRAAAIGVTLEHHETGKNPKF
jgi:hypothetical protein